MEPGELNEWIRSWKEGIEHFNERRFWEAHEAWERGWVRLPGARKLHIQALIQSAAVFHLIGLGRARAARSLAKRALEKFAEVHEATRASFPRIDVPGLESALADVANAPSDMAEAGFAELAARIRLRAELLLSPRP